MSMIEKTAAALMPAEYESHYLTVAGVKLHYQDYGDKTKPPMVCIHGGAAHAHWFDFVASELKKDFHVIAINQRGHGDSGWASPPDYSYARYAADLNEAFEKLNLQNFILVGHSMGGVVSTLYAATYPGRAKAFILIDSTITMPEDRIASMHEVGNREGRSYASEGEFLERYKLRPAGTTATAEVVGHLARHSGRVFEDGRWRHKFDRNVYALRERMDSLPYWANIKIPALLVKGDLSQRISAEVVGNVRALCPQIQTAEVAHSDHHVTLDNPSGFVQAVGPFLRSLSSFVGG